MKEPEGGEEVLKQAQGGWGGEDERPNSLISEYEQGRRAGCTDLLLLGCREMQGRFLGEGQL